MNKIPLIPADAGTEMTERGAKRSKRSSGRSTESRDLGLDVGRDEQKSLAASKPFGAWEIGLALRYLRAKRKEGGIALISILAFVGIMLAVAMLIIVTSVMNGFRVELLDRIVGFNGHIYVQGQPIETAGREALLNRLRKIPGVVQVSPLTETQALAESATQVQGAIVRGITRRTLTETPIVKSGLRSGSLAGFGEGEDGGDTVLMGDRLASNLGVNAGDWITLVSPSGSSTALGSMPIQKRYRVGAVFSIGMAEYDQVFIFMPLEQSQLFFGKQNYWDVVEVKVANPDRLDNVKAEVARTAGPTAAVTDWRDRNASFFNALQVEHVTMLVILGLIVLVAAMIIISGLVMLVKNKGRDIAILRTMGASSGSMLRIFFMTGSIIGCAGTLAGLLLSVLFLTFIGQIQKGVEWVTGRPVFSPEVYFLKQIPHRMDPVEVSGIVLFALIASCLATLPPAWRAARLDPVEALRYE
jgi:lipoprotein-releasing system permease protein